ncbi:MAG: hypothetical protein ACLFPE_03935 [Bacteroidales bacterium]
MNDDVKVLLDHCRKYAEDQLMETGELFPFGALTDDRGLTHHREVEVEKGGYIPSNGEIMDDLLNYFDEEMKAGRARAWAITFEANVKIDESNSTDTICVDILHRDLEDVPVYHFPFEMIDDETPVFGEPFAVER